MGSIEYDAINIDPSKDRKDYSWQERRAEILQLIERAGHPRALNQRQLSREFDVSPSQINQDFDALAEYIAEHLDREHEFIMDRVLQGSVLNLVQEGEHFKAAKVARMWYDWLADVGAVTRAPDELSVDATVREAKKETESYKLLSDDRAITLENDGFGDIESNAIRSKDNPQGQGPELNDDSGGETHDE
jgi:hypothetical protein